MLYGVIGEETKEAKDYEEDIEVEERFGNDVDRNLRLLEALGWFGFDQVSKEIIKSLTEGGEVSFIWEGGKVGLEIGIQQTPWHDHYLRERQTLLNGDYD